MTESGTNRGRELQLTKKSASGRTVVAIPAVVTCVYGAAEMPEETVTGDSPCFRPHEDKDK
jgi:hypothetical protein